MKDWLETEPAAVPRFFEVSGLIAGMLICPRVLTPLKVLDVLWGPEGRAWENQEEAGEFCDLLMDYWNYANDLVQESLAPDAAPASHFIDVQEGDYDPNDKLQLSVIVFCWATGFLRAAETWPESWGDALTRPDLAPHWEVVRWWAELTRPGNFARLNTAAEGGLPLTVAAVALARALRVEGAK